MKARLLVAVVVCVALLGLGLGGAGGSADVPAGVCSAPPWDGGVSYPAGSVVSHNGHEWRAAITTWPGLEPGTGAVPPWWAPWADLGSCAGSGAATPPPQPSSGPGGTDYPHGGWSVSSGGSGNDAWYVFQPAEPRPAAAPVAIVLHGFGEYAGYDSLYNLIRHAVRKGYVVVYPRWQTSAGSPNPLSIEAPLAAATNGVRGGLAWLQADTANRVQPRLDQVGYFGFSYGGMIAATMANRHRSIGTPVPRSLFTYEPTGGVLGDLFDRSMSGVPSTTKVVCQVSQQYTDTATGCFSLFPEFGHVANADKDFVTMYSDTYGDPDLVAVHQSVCSPPSGASVSEACGTSSPEVRTDALDYFGIWRSWIALQSCANAGADCRYGLNDTPEHRHMGVWSDGRAVRELRIGDIPAAP